MKRILRILLMALLVFVVAILIAGLIAPKEHKVSASVDINVPSFVAFEQIRYFKNYIKWHPILKKDPSIGTTVQENDGALGSIRYWNSAKNDVGRGSDKITKLQIPYLLESEVEISEPRAGKGNNVFKLEEVGGVTRVNWDFVYKIPYPWNAFTLFSSPTSGMGGDFKKGLEDLKGLLSVVKKSGINYVARPGQFDQHRLATRKIEMNYNDIHGAVGKLYPSIEKKMNDQGIRRTGSNMVLIHKWDEETNVVQASVGIPISLESNVEGLDMFDIRSRPSYRAASIGNRDNAGDVHVFLKKYIEDNAVNLKYPLIEEYIKGPLSRTGEGEEVTAVTYLYN